MPQLITHAELQRLVKYNPNTGHFVWLIGTKKGKIAGSKRSEYPVLRLGYRLYKEHILAWFYVHGQWPVRYLDHINGNKKDNRICNLRDVSQSINLLNSNYSRNKHGHKGITYRKDMKSNRRWCAHIKIQQKDIWLGCFATKEEAISHYKLMKQRYIDDVCTIRE